jgi:hypothetical protein
LHEADDRIYMHVRAAKQQTAHVMFDEVVATPLNARSKVKEALLQIPRETFGHNVDEL